MHSQQQKMQQRQQHSLHRNAGPHICAAITHGFQLNLRRPVGGGKNGSMLGVSRPLPTGQASAYAFGTSSNDTRILPSSSSFPDDVLLRV